MRNKDLPPAEAMTVQPSTQRIALLKLDNLWLVISFIQYRHNSQDIHVRMGIAKGKLDVQIVGWREIEIIFVDLPVST